MLKRSLGANVKNSQLVSRTRDGSRKGEATQSPDCPAHCPRARGCLFEKGGRDKGAEADVRGVCGRRHRAAAFLRSL